MYLCSKWTIRLLYSDFLHHIAEVFGCDDNPFDLDYDTFTEYLGYYIEELELDEIEYEKAREKVVVLDIASIEVVYE